MKFGINFPIHSHLVGDFISEARPDFIIYSVPTEPDEIQSYIDKNLDNISQIRRKFDVELFCKNCEDPSFLSNKQLTFIFTRQLLASVKIGSSGFFFPGFDPDSILNQEKLIRQIWNFTNNKFRIIFPEEGVSEAGKEYIHNLRRHKFRYYYDLSRVYETNIIDLDALKRTSMISTPFTKGEEIPDGLDKDLYFDTMDYLLDNKDHELYNFIFVPSTDVGIKKQVSEFTQKRKRIKSKWE